jgi:hypothetical protein
MKSTETTSLTGNPEEGEGPAVSFPTHEFSWQEMRDAAAQDTLSTPVLPNATTAASNRRVNASGSSPAAIVKVAPIQTAT